VTVPDDVLRRLAAAVRSHPVGLSRTRLVVVDGPAGSGKTTLASQLEVALAAQVVHMDDLYDGWTGLRAGVRTLVEDVLVPLSVGLPGSFRRFDWERGEYAETREVPVCSTLLVEGCGSAPLEIDEHDAFVVWVEADDEVRLARGLARDGAASRPEWERFMRDERELYAEHRTAERAHVRLDGVGRWVGTGAARVRR
jgi:energy-coupling factor transporter ATP-binding protein EcfA2